MAKQRWQGLYGIFSPAMTCHEGIHNGTSALHGLLQWQCHPFAAWIRDSFSQMSAYILPVGIKTGGDLNAIFKIKDILYILVRSDAAGSYYRDFVPGAA